MNLSNPLSLWSQLSSLCFFCAGIYGDLLLIRLFCFLAYSLLLWNAFVGSPGWPNLWNNTDDGSVVVLLGGGNLPGIDTLIWSSVCLYVHGSSLISLLLDEKQVRLTPDEEALWRLFYRTAGLSKRLFQALFIASGSSRSPCLTVMELESGKLIPTDDYFYVIYKGQVQLQVLDPMTGIPTTGRILGSGETFDLKHLGLFSTETIFDEGDIKCTSLTFVKLFQIPKHHLKQMAHHPLAKTAFQALLINNLSFAAESFMNADTTTNGGGSRRSFKAAENYADRIFQPLQQWEQPPPYAAGSGRALENLILALRHFWQALFHSISPPWPFAGHPTGIRQTQLVPPSQRRQQRDGGEGGGGGAGGEDRLVSSTGSSSDRRGLIIDVMPLFRRLSASFRRRNNIVLRNNNNSNQQTVTDLQAEMIIHGNGNDHGRSVTERLVDQWSDHLPGALWTSLAPELVTFPPPDQAFYNPANSDPGGVSGPPRVVPIEDYESTASA